MHCRQLRILIISFVLLFAGSGCVYFNTFFNARKSYNSAEKNRLATGRGSQNDYKTAIDKCLKIIENHPNSKYYDDALFILGASYFHTGQFSRAERRLRELLANYPESDYEREADMLLAKSKLQLGEVDGAMALFEEIFATESHREERAEAARALADFYSDQKKYEQARIYLMSVRDSLGNDTQRKEAQRQLADNYFVSFQFADALGGYLQMLGMKPNKAEEYHALFHAALSSYRLQRIPDGIDYLNKLAKDQFFFDSLEVVKLAIGEGYELEGDLIPAEQAYQDLAINSKSKAIEAEAWYRLGLIYQYDYDNLKEARAYYDKAIKAYPGGESAKDALQRSAYISKLGEYTTSIKIDTNATQEQIDRVAATQYQLADLYWFNLNKPDSAIYELQFLIDSFPEAKIAPQALITLAGMHRDHLGDTARADSLLQMVAERYPTSDMVGQAVEHLGWRGTERDTGYAEAYFRRAEDFLIDSNNVDSAKYYYQKVVNEFPESELNLQARFNLVWLMENYESPGDSSVLYAYQEIIDSFPNSPQANAARTRVAVPLANRRAVQHDSLQAAGQEGDTAFTQIQPLDSNGFIDPNLSDTSAYVDPLTAVYIGPEGDSIPNVEVQPIQIDEPFEFPNEAYTITEDQFYLYFQIFLDFSGKVTEYILKIPSANEEINRRATETVASMTFDMQRIRPENYNRWMVYKLLITKPDYLR